MNCAPLQTVRRWYTRSGHHPEWFAAQAGISFLPHRAPSRSGCRSNWTYAYIDASTSTAQSSDCGVAALRVHLLAFPEIDRGHVLRTVLVLHLLVPTLGTYAFRVVSESCAKFHDCTRSRRREIHNQSSYINCKFTQESIQINSMCSHANIPERLVVFFPFGEH